MYDKLARHARRVQLPREQEHEPVFEGGGARLTYAPVFERFGPRTP